MKGIIKYKLKSAKPALIACVIILIASVIVLFVDFYSFENVFGTFYMNRIDENLIWAPIALILLATWLGLIFTSEYGNKDTECFFAVLPVKNRDRFIVSLMLGIGVLLVMGVITLIAVCISHSISFTEFARANLFSENYEIITKMDGLGNALVRIIQMYVFAIMFYCIAVFAGVSARDKRVAVLIIIMVLFFPTVMGTIIQLLEKIFSIDFSAVEKLINYGSCYQLTDWNACIYVNDEFFVCYDNVLESIVVAGVMVVIYVVGAFLMATVANRNSGNIVIGKGMEKVFIAAIAINVASVVSALLVSTEFDSSIVIAIMIVVFALIVFGLFKIIYYGKKYSHLNAKEGTKNEK